MKLLSIVLLSLVSVACQAENMKNGYDYEQWGNNFISVTVNGETRQAIEGQVERYSVNADFLIAAQEDLESATVAYWIINMLTHEKERYSDAAVFKKESISKGFGLAKIHKVIGI